MSPAKPKKIYQVAKELNVASPAIVEYLEDQGFEVAKKPKHMSPLTDEMYEQVIKKFDPVRWQRQMEDEAKSLEDARRAESDKARNEQLHQLLDNASDQAIDSARGLIRQVEAEEAKREDDRKKEEEDTQRLLAEQKAKEEAEAKAKAEAEAKVRAEREAAEAKAKAEAEKKRLEEAQRRKKAPDRAAKPAAAKSKDEKPKPEKGKAEKPKKAKEAETEEAKAKDSRKRRTPSKADIERIEKQKKLLASQKQEKYKKVTPAPEPRQRRRKQKRKKVDAHEVSATIKQTLAQMDTGKRRAKRRDRQTGELIEQEDNILRLTEFVATQELANLMDVDVAEVIKKFFSMGKMVTINQRLEQDLIELVADEFGFTVEFVTEEEHEEVEVVDEDRPEDLVERPPVVTVMGHVDHGKTSLLDFLRHTAVIASEHGGITQHIGAYELKHNDRKITFLDTPGHEAFTAMRARGAQVTDLVVLVVAADDHVRPQTIEAISHAQSADVPIIVAINKIDKPDADPERIRKELAAQNILVEQWGGKIQSAEISAKFGQGVEGLLEEILLAADILELKANPNRRARATVVETRLEKGRGMVATIVVTTGTLHIGDHFVAGQQFGKVRSLMDEFDQAITSVSPGCPAQVVGFSGAPQSGDAFVVLDSEKEVKDIAMRRQLLQREQTFRQIKMLSLDQISQQIKEGAVKELSLIVKGDADGSVEAICDTLQRIAAKGVKVRIAHKGVGAITESDVLLASATGSIILGFHVHPNLKARDLAMQEKVDIRTYRIIYEMENDVRSALEGLLEPDTREDVIGLVEVRDIFRIPSIGTIAGCQVISGKVTRSNEVRLLREGRQVWRGRIGSLKRFKNDASEVKSGLECGIGLDGMNDVKVGDSIEVIEIVKVKRKLESSTA
ncbi:translation initiation factor IF-2 [bacterium]|nr:translation initiation factor IF-2 [bacterium]